MISEQTAVSIAGSFHLRSTRQLLQSYHGSKLDRNLCMTSVYLGQELFRLFSSTSDRQKSLVESHCVLPSGLLIAGLEQDHLVLCDLSYSKLAPPILAGCFLFRETVKLLNRLTLYSYPSRPRQQDGRTSCKKEAIEAKRFYRWR